MTRRDRLFIAVCVALAAVSIVVIARYFSTAFPEASIDFKYDRGTSKPIAERLVPPNLRDAKHAVSFESDGNARIFLERSLGLERANEVMKSQVRVWYWHHRWFRPLVQEEISVDVAPSGEIVSFQHVIPEDRAIANGDAMSAATAFLDRIGVRRNDLTLVDESQRRLPKRVQRIYTFESKSIRPANAPYRHVVTIDGNIVTGYSQRLKVPDAWLRSYRELRSKNLAAGAVDTVLMAATMIAALVLFIVFLRRGDLNLRFLAAVGVASAILSAGVALNSMPAELAYYDTTTSFPAFIAQLAIFGVVQALGNGMLLVVICGAGEVLYRRRLPNQLAIPRLWTPKALASKRVFLGLILGYALVPLFIAYQVLFYLGARRIGAWAPAEVPYDAMLNSAFPWVMVLFAGFFPAVSEEFLSRAFSIPFFQSLVRSRWFAIVLAGFLWGFGHSTYPNQPFWIRGVEVGIVGVVAGLLMDRFGLLPLLIWHYTIDAVYTATLLFASGNAYYIASAAVSSLIFAVPLVASIALYVRNRGFLPDDDLTNATDPVSEPPPRPEVARAAAELPPAMHASPRMWMACLAAVLIAAIAVLYPPPGVNDAIDYRINGDEAKRIAKTHVREPFKYVIATPVEGFRAWDADSPREDGGAPGGFDDVAATYLVQNGVSTRELTRIFRRELQAGIWVVRFFTPLDKKEIFVEIDPRTSRVIGYHKYLDEQTPGASLSQAEALAIARRAFGPYAIDVDRFEVKDALSFQQPRRRDWLFHFQDRTPLGADAFRRVAVRVAGSEVTQFNKYVHVPESVHREAGTRTFMHVVLMALKIAGAIALLALVVTGIILASRAHGLRWRRAMKWTLLLSVIPIANAVAQYEQMLFGYNTSVAWETFRVRMATEFVRNIGLQAGLLFLALAGLEAAVPYALSLATREGRARFGRGAAVAAVTAVAVLTIAAVAGNWLDALFPRLTQVSLSIAGAIATPMPSLIEASQAIVAALIVSGAVALYPLALRKHLGFVTIAAVFCAVVDPSVTTAQAPMMLARSLALAALLWLVARYVLGANPLAWPLAIFIGLSVQTAAALIANQRNDLIAHGVALVVFAAAAIVWSAAPWPSRSRPAVSVGPSTSTLPTAEPEDGSPTSPATSERSG
jgi:Type II CAAX prenyl endopeptidase Rce1-like